MIDIHTHLLPGVDDGSPNVEVSVRVLTTMGQEGVSVLVCTPHLRATEAARIDETHHATVFSTLVEHAPQRPKLLRGYEIMLDAPGTDLRPAHLHLGGSSAVLVEFPRMQVPVGAARELLRLRLSGVVPVLAHPERYVGCTIEMVEEWRGVGAVIQTDAAVLLGSGSMSLLARRLLERGLVDCLASDNHGDHRSLAHAERWLLEIGATEQARLLTHVNAERMLTGQPVLPVSPVPALDRGVLGRLRDLLLGRARPSRRPGARRA
ncbi:MAG TPA: CpsB/CapC family capsule biosynthesis tyrosine phosphatase [Gemmatimonadaceae bacterium]|nr:CpsB/CapC family capsule biosynthesis tyrosine phosphatase [Gemmatimonadaceae bacterium]